MADRGSDTPFRMRLTGVGCEFIDPDEEARFWGVVWRSFIRRTRWAMLATVAIMVGGEFVRLSAAGLDYPTISLALRLAAYPTLALAFLSTFLAGPNRIVGFAVVATVAVFVGEWLSNGILGPPVAQLNLTGFLGAAFVLIFFAPKRFAVMATATAIIVAANLVETYFRGFTLQAIGFDVLTTAGFFLAIEYSRQTNYDMRYRYFAQRQLARALDRLAEREQVSIQESQRLAKLLTAIPEPALVIDAQQRPLAWNDALLDLY
ncbi:MAG: hypothetical protein FJX65_02020 [Alphaproteobacteria bacterium]|nr:hypothetical protein [Alphaproteobacteria bacterium]